MLPDDVMAKITSGKLLEYAANREGDGDLPDRFEATGGPEKDTVTVKDTETGRRAVVPIFAWTAIRRALGDLFG